MKLFPVVNFLGHITSNIIRGILKLCFVKLVWSLNLSPSC